jgi:pyruvate formate lyase activating enzyme
MKKEYNQEGYIHSLESFGTVDGPGVRFVVFFQGCPMRCLYCHNPDTWKPGEGNRMSAAEILEAYKKNEVFYKNGGITATGGEPLMQLPFLTELFSEAKKQGIHTCLDTSGIMYRKERQEEFERLFDVLDLVLLDFKHSSESRHKELTGLGQKQVLEFAHALEERGIPFIARHVVVPGITDGVDHLNKLGKLLAGFSNIKGLEVLPYHTMGRAKYENLGIPYPLENIENMDAEKAKDARNIILRAFQEARSKINS